MNKVLILTRNCNLNCSYCYQKKLSNHFNSNMKTETIDEILLNHNNGHLVELFGGEPFMNKEALKHILNNHKDKVYKITTNVFSIDLNIMEAFIKNGMLSVLKMSIDPIGSFNRYDEDTEKKVIEKFMKVVEMISKYKSKVKAGVIMVFAEKDFGKVFEMYKFINDIAIKNKINIGFSALWENDMTMNEINTKILFENEFPKILDYDKENYYEIKFSGFKPTKYKFCTGDHIESFNFNGDKVGCYHELFEGKPDNALDNNECDECRLGYCVPCKMKSKNKCGFYKNIKKFLEEVLN